MFIIKSITIFFSLLILFTLIRYFTKPTIIEGATGEYQNYSDDPLILAKKNAANIDILKKQNKEAQKYVFVSSGFVEDYKFLSEIFSPNEL